MKYADISHIPIAKETGYKSVAVFHEGTPVFYDTFAGMVPCKVIKVFKTALGFVVGPTDELLIRVIQTVGAYKKGEELKVNAFYCPPKVMRRIAQYSYRINSGYCFVPEGETP
jgi:hypothetical protein